MEAQKRSLLGKLHELIIATRNDDRVGRMTRSFSEIAVSSSVCKLTIICIPIRPRAMGFPLPFRRGPRCRSTKIVKNCRRLRRPPSPTRIAARSTHGPTRTRRPASARRSTSPVASGENWPATPSHTAPETCRARAASFCLPRVYARRFSAYEAEVVRNSSRDGD